MNEIDPKESSFGSYENFKSQFDSLIYRTASNFMQIGVMLKEARDTNILSGSGYSGMGEFAEKEYGLRPDQTSRYISCAEKYADEHGNLLPQYKDHSQSALIEMLTLPESVAEVIPAEMSRDDIRTLKDEVAEEGKITPLEVMTEEGQTDDDDLVAMLTAYFNGRPQDAEKAVKVINSDPNPEGETSQDVVIEALAPTGIAMLESRPAGRGKIILSINGRDKLPRLVKIREDTNKECDWVDIEEAIGIALSKAEIKTSDKPEDEKDTAKEAEPKEAKEAAGEKLKIAPAQTEEPKAEEKTEPEKETYKDSPENISGEIHGHAAPPSENDFMNPPTEKELRGSEDGRECVRIIKSKTEFLETILKNIKRLKPDEDYLEIQNLQEQLEGAEEELYSTLSDFIEVRRKEES